MLSVNEINTFYGASQALHDLTLEVHEGEFLGVLGRNGMGKTTLIHSIAGLLRPHSGSISLGDKRLDKLPAERVAAAGISLVPQGHRIFPSLTVKENLGIAVHKTGLKTAWTVDDVYDRFPVLVDRSNLRAGLLSGGQQQMLAMGRALVRNAKLVLMDEPTEGLDPQTVARIGEVIDELRTRGTSGILVEQKVDFALRRVDRAVVVSRGSIAHTADDPARLRSDSAQLRRLLGVGGPTSGPDQALVEQEE
ncbi:MAG: ABC transporter ATP-binding protein [Actinomycetota bacterium]|nr:ABC transporter ATP-binding protein [Actinomycetota bacterium]